MGNNITEIRKAQGISQTQLATMANVSRPYLSAIEKGHQTVISNTVMLKIANALSKPVSDIFFSVGVVCKQQEAAI